MWARSPSQKDPAQIDVPAKEHTDRASKIPPGALGFNPFPEHRPGSQQNGRIRLAFPPLARVACSSLSTRVDLLSGAVSARTRWGKGRWLRQCRSPDLPPPVMAFGCGG